MIASGTGCPVCGAGEWTRVVEQNCLAVVRCQRCGHGYVWPVPAATVLNAIYDRSYYRGSRGSVGFSDYDSLAPARRRMFSRHLDRLARVIAAGCVLDVGCATGDFLQVARARGWDTLGVDPSPAREQARAAGLALCGSTIHDAEVPPGSVGLITYWDVLEHVPDPVADLRRAAELLQPGGIVACTVPRADGVMARLSGRRWFGYKTAGEHLQFFTRATLGQTLRRAGFEVLVQRPVTWSCTVAFLVDRAALYLGPVGRLLNAALARSPLASIIVDVPQVNQFAIARKR